MKETSTPLLLEYRLLEVDIRQYLASGRARKCWRSCRRRKVAILLLIALGLFLVGVCYHAKGARSGSLALGTTLAILAGLAWSREALAENRACRLARAMGIPRGVRLVVSPVGVAEEPGPGGFELSRTFAWPEVVDVSRVDHLTIIRLRPAGGVLIVPDRAFNSPDGRGEFEANLRAWRAGSGDPGGGT